MWHTLGMVAAAVAELESLSELAHTFSSNAFSRNFAGGYTLDSIRAGRDAQSIGNFRVSVPLSETMKCEASIFTALLNRIAPHRGLERAVETGDDQLADEAKATFGRDGPAIPAGTVADGHERVAMNGLWVGQNVWEPRSDGSRVDVRLQSWPLGRTYWNAHQRQLIAETTEGPQVITHGDGKWVVAALHDDEPWMWGATKPLAVTFADLQFGKRDRSQHSESHGLGHFIGELPKGMALDHPDAKLFNTWLQQLWNTRSGGAVPEGSKVQLLESMAAGWQIFRELMKSGQGDAFRVLLGQDGTVTNEGGNYIKAAQLYGVRQDLIEGDLDCFGRALTSGVLVPWSLVNFGENIGISTRWLYPDPDEDLRRQSLAARVADFNKSIEAYRANGYEVDQAFSDKLAAQYGVPAPQFVVSQADGALTVTEFRAKTEAKGAAVGAAEGSEAAADDDATTENDNDNSE